MERAVSERQKEIYAKGVRELEEHLENYSEGIRSLSHRSRQRDPQKKRKWGEEIESTMSVIPTKERPLGGQGLLARRQKSNTKT